MHTSSSIHALKAEAKQLRAESIRSGTNLSHCNCLDQAARNNGFRDWQTARATLLNSATNNVLIDVASTIIAATSQAQPTPAARNIQFRPVTLDELSSAYTVLQLRKELAKEDADFDDIDSARDPSSMKGVLKRTLNDLRDAGAEHALQVVGKRIVRSDEASLAYRKSGVKPDQYITYVESPSAAFVCLTERMASGDYITYTLTTNNEWSIVGADGRNFHCFGDIRVIARKEAALLGIAFVDE